MSRRGQEMEDRRDNSAVMAALGTLTNVIQQGFDSIDKRLTESHRERRQAEADLWLAMEQHQGRSQDSHHSQLDVRVQRNEDMTKRINTVYATIAALLTLFTGGLALLSPWVRSHLP